VGVVILSDDVSDDAESMDVVILSDDVSDDDCIDDQTECDGYYMEPTESDRTVQQTRSRVIVAAQKWTQLAAVFIGKDKAKWDRVKPCTHFRRRWQNILTKLPGVTGQARKAITTSEACSVSLHMKI
jgi:hypothetical protein